MSHSEAYARAGIKGVVMNFSDSLRNPARGLTQTAKKLYDKYPLVEREEIRHDYNKKKKKFETKGGGLKITKTGYGALGGAALLSNAMEAYDNYIIHHMGAVDPNKVTATPDYNPQEYSIQSPDFAGATRDLVFALHANR